MNSKILKKIYDDVCNEYVRLFCKKQELDFNGWIGNDVGGIAEFANEYFFNITDIIIDIDTNQKKELILDWQTEGVEYNMFERNIQNINYKSYTMGLRYEHLNTNVDDN